MKVITFSKQFPLKHPREGDATHFVEKVWSSLGMDSKYLGVLPIAEMGFMSERFDDQPKHHTIRAGNRWEVGDKFSARVWSGKPYQSKQIEFAQIEIKQLWNFHVSKRAFYMDGMKLDSLGVKTLAENDGLTVDDFEAWFPPVPDKNGQFFRGQVICWNETVSYREHLKINL